MSKLITKKNLTPFQESLLVLATLSNQIEKALKAMVPEDRIDDDGLKFTITNHIYIILYSFLEEWRKLEALGSDDKIQATLRIASPALNRIRQWKGLSKVRSMLLAHGHRDNKGKLVLPYEVFDTYNAPTAYAETILLGNCSILAVKVLLTQHKSDYQEAVQQISKLEQDIEDKGIRTVGEIKAELQTIKDEMLAEISNIAGVNIDSLRKVLL